MISLEKHFHFSLVFYNLSESVKLQLSFWNTAKHKISFHSPTFVLPQRRGLINISLFETKTTYPQKGGKHVGFVSVLCSVFMFRMCVGQIVLSHIHCTVAFSMYIAKNIFFLSSPHKKAQQFSWDADCVSGGTGDQVGATSICQFFGRLGSE